MKEAKGTVFKFGDNVDTDVIIPARYLNTTDHAELAAHCMEDIDKEFVKNVVDSLGLSNKLDRLPSKLSGGQQQRVAIARALASKPAIILADEPTGNLDSKTSQDVLNLLGSTGKMFNQTIVMITHNDEIAQMADRTIRIEDGHII